MFLAGFHTRLPLTATGTYAETCVPTEELRDIHDSGERYILFSIDTVTTTATATTPCVKKHFRRHTRCICPKSFSRDFNNCILISHAASKHFATLASIRRIMIDSQYARHSLYTRALRISPAHSIHQYSYAARALPPKLASLKRHMLAIAQH